VLTLITGIVIVQISTVAISPILTYLFSPSAFGVFVVYLPIARRQPNTLAIAVSFL
jgi:hypothetical protein